jgi:hypothetical protein
LFLHIWSRAGDTDDSPPRRWSCAGITQDLGVSIAASWGQSRLNHGVLKLLGADDRSSAACRIGAAFKRCPLAKELLLSGEIKPTVECALDLGIGS